MMEMRFSCELTWEELNGDSDVRRHCDSCDHAVYNLSGMTRGQARRLIEEHESDLCVRFVSRDGHIIHNGDPLEQLRTQRFGARKLLMGAVAIQLGLFAVADGPVSTLFNPIALVGELFGSSCATATMGEPAPPPAELPRVGYATGEQPTCDSPELCLAAAEQAYARANELAESDSSGSGYAEYKELDKTGRLLRQGGFDLRFSPASIPDFYDRATESEQQLDERFAKYRMKHLNFEKRKQYNAMADNLDEWIADFPDPNSRWGDQALMHKRRMQDDGTWPQNR